MNSPSPTFKYSSLALCLTTLVMLLTGSGALAQQAPSACGEIRSGDDYRTVRRDVLELVERYHFTPEVEALIRGKQSTEGVGIDLSYTLGAFPNHHRALMSMMLLGKKLNTPQPPRAQYSVECYFLRALRFRPDDAIARMMYANFLSSQSRAIEASQELKKVSQVASDNAFIYYNVGQIYFDLKDYDKALENAHKAARLGLTLTGLQARLTSAGQWREAGLTASSPELDSSK
jgi:tetratricopeptide (TPR) repeat protein